VNEQSPVSGEEGIACAEGDACPLLRYALQIVVPLDVHNALAAALRGVPGASVPESGFHVTLYGPFSFNGDGAAALARLRREVNALAPFELQVQGLGCFREPDENVAYLRVGWTPQLLRLHTIVVQTLDGLTVSRHPLGENWDLWRYTPHISLGLHIPDREIDALLQQLSPLQADFHFRLQQTELLQQGPLPDWSWRVRETFALSG
jgi:2'-5' RNA ligase